MKLKTHLIRANIENLTSLWQTASIPFRSYFIEANFKYCLIENSDWPHKLWFERDIKEENAVWLKEKLHLISTKLSIPYFDIYGSKSYEILEASGFTVKTEQVGMSLELGAPLYQLVNDHSNLKIKLISNNRDAKLWSDLFFQAFRYHIIPEILVETQEKINYYIAYHEDQPVGTAILYGTNNIAGVHSMGIIPEMRRRGFAESMMGQLINKSIQGKFQYSTLQASAMGKGLYLKLGFQEQFRIKNYTLVG